MNDSNKPSGKIDKLVMGIILGGAIGSVLGLTLAPRKGKETREIIKQKSGELIDKGKEVSQNFIRDYRETFESAKYHLKKRKGFFRWVLTLIGKKKGKAVAMPKATMETPYEIPNEESK